MTSDYIIDANMLYNKNYIIHINHNLETTKVLDEEISKIPHYIKYKNMYYDAFTIMGLIGKIIILNHLNGHVTASYYLPIEHDNLYKIIETIKYNLREKNYLVLHKTSKKYHELTILW
jgi:hypothetical protein